MEERGTPRLGYLRRISGAKIPLVEADALDAQVQRLKARGFVTTWHEGVLQIGWKIETVTPENGSEPLVVYISAH